jgi:hypothetical protein
MVVHGRRGIRGVIMVDAMLDLSRFDIVAPGTEGMEAAWAAGRSR